MSALVKLWTGLIAFVIACGTSALSAPVPTEKDLVWNSGGISASVANVPLKRLLGRISALSGWKVYVDPSIDTTITTRFRNARQAEALKLLLGSVNYALVPQSGGASKLFVYRNNLADATSLVAPDAARGKNWIANEIILTLGPDSKIDVESLAAELGAKIVGKNDGLNAYRLQFADAEAAQTARDKLAARQGFDQQDNYSFDRPTSPGAGSSASMASIFPLDAKPVTRGDQVTVALVDTAVQPLDGKMKEFMLPSVHVSGAPDSLPSDPTHATSMAETLLNSLVFTKGAGDDASKLGNVRILPIDIYGNSPTTTTFEVAQGLHKAIQSGSQVINLSLGGTGESPMVDYLLEMAKKKEILVFASAGNSPTTDLTWPAANPNAIAVTAADASGNIASYANRGAFVDVKAPGTSRIFYNGQTYLSRGTSTATAFVSGQAAGLAAQGFNSAQTTEMILRNFDVHAAPVANGPTKK